MYPKVIIHNNSYEDSSTSTNLERLSELFNRIKEKEGLCVSGFFFFMRLFK
ncbi:hypothetical protein FORC10_2056 [Bacillus cereus]|nr:hypothetical protein FORC10_2056 [Bacillus cereus]